MSEKLDHTTHHLNLSSEAAIFNDLWILGSFSLVCNWTQESGLATADTTLGYKGVWAAENAKLIQKNNHKPTLNCQFMILPPET